MNHQHNNKNKEAVKKPKLRAVCYIRQALAKDGDTNLARQRQSCEKAAADLNAEIVGNYEDLGVSGHGFKRPGLSADDDQSLPPSIIRKLERTLADLDRRIDREAAARSRRRGKPTL